MRFIDEATIKISAGHGGPGCVSFRRETFIPRGGPDGGDGGDGGNVIFKTDSQLSTLQDFRFKRIYQAPNGMHGSGANKAGRDGEDILIRIPMGTVIKDGATGETLLDFTRPNETWVACKGGRGGKGNTHFTTSTHQAPKFAQPGEEGETREIKLELKLLADVAILGFPNAGKSTLISRISAARPKIADYPFTTLTPNLGVVFRPGHKTFIVADIPGLIEGAHRGLGLGHRFLKHIERTKLFIHVLDGAQFLEDATAPDDKSFDRAVSYLSERYQSIRKELGFYNPELLTKPEIVVLNKLDLLDSNPNLIEKAKQALQTKIATLREIPPSPVEPFIVSAVSGQGIETLLNFVEGQLKQLTSEAEALPLPLPDDEALRT